jgi:hypothetical protein
LRSETAFLTPKNILKSLACAQFCRTDGSGISARFKRPAAELAAEWITRVTAEKNSTSTYPNQRNVYHANEAIV